MFEKIKEKFDPKSDAKRTSAEVKIPMHPNVLKTLEDQEIKRRALAKQQPEAPFHSDIQASSAGYSQNTTNGSVWPDGQVKSGKIDSDDPDFETRKAAQDEGAEELRRIREKEQTDKEKASSKETKEEDKKKPSRK